MTAHFSLIALLRHCCFEHCCISALLRRSWEGFASIQTLLFLGNGRGVRPLFGGGYSLVCRCFLSNDWLATFHMFFYCFPRTELIKKNKFLLHNKQLTSTDREISSTQYLMQTKINSIQAV